MCWVMSYGRVNLYIAWLGPGKQHTHFQSLPGDLAVVEGQRNGKLSVSCKFSQVTNVSNKGQTTISWSEIMLI